MSLVYPAETQAVLIIIFVTYINQNNHIINVRLNVQRVSARGGLCKYDEKRNEKNVHRVFGVAAILLLVVAALFVGSAAAETKTYEVSSVSELVTAVENLSVDTDVAIKLIQPINLAELKEDQYKKIFKSLHDTIWNGTEDYSLNLMFNEKSLTMEKDGKKVQISGTPDANILLKACVKEEGKIPKDFTLSISSGVTAIAGKSTGNEKITIMTIQDIPVSLKYNNDFSYKLTAVKSEPFANCIIEGESIEVSKLSINDQLIWLKVNPDPMGIEIKETLNEDSVQGVVYLNGANVTVNTDDFFVNIGKTRSIGMSVDAEINSGTLWYNNAEITIANLEGKCAMDKDAGFSSFLQGTATLKDDIKLTKHIPLPNFVEYGNLIVYLNDKMVTFTSTDGRILTTSSPKEKITLVGPGTFSQEVKDN